MKSSREEGWEKGWEEGVEKGLELAARGMLERGMALQEVADITGLLVEKLQYLVLR